MTANDIYQHYRPDESDFIDAALGWMQWVDNRFAAYLSPFLTPREAKIVRQLVGNHNDIKVAFNGGYTGSERQRALLYPLYYEVKEEDFDLQALNINFPEKFAELSHGRILGTFMSTGIDRNRIGDIISDGQSWHMIVDASMTDYFVTNIHKIANFGVHLELISCQDLLESEESWQTIFVVASSLRLDTLLSKVYNFSRQRAKNSVSSGLVKVNFLEMNRPDVQVGEEDIVSLRHFGRFWIKHIDGKTRKDNYKLQINVLDN